MSEGSGASAITQLKQITAELSARRELRDRAAAQGRAQSRSTLQQIGAVSEKVFAHRAELGKRQREAGGWVTEKTLADKNHHIGFLNEDDADDAFTGHTVPVNAAPDPVTVREEEPRRAQPVARRPRTDEDDDFSDTSSWLQD